MDEDHRELLVRIDERTQDLSDDVQKLRSDLEGQYVTRTEFEPVRMVVFGLVGTILLSTIAAVMALILKA